MQNEMKVMEQENFHLRRVLQNLVSKLQEIDRHPMVAAVFTIAMIHGVKYDGPQYSEELAAAVDMLKELR